MKKTITLLLSLVLTAVVGCTDDEPDIRTNQEIDYPAYADKEFDNGSGIDYIELNEQLTENLVLLGRIWGFLKYHHPEVGKGNYNWDYELFRILPKYLQVNNTEERDNVLSDWIERYGEIPVCSTCSETPPTAFIKPNLLWAESSNMNNALKAKIREIYQNRHQGEHFYIRMDNNTNKVPEFLHEKVFTSMECPDAGIRLLALYRYWNMIHYFFPYKHLTDKNWDDILQEYVPMLISVENRLDYDLVISQLVAETHDSHANGFGIRLKLDELRGYNYAPFQARFIEGKFVVSRYYRPDLQVTTGLKVGDVITHINGEAVETIVENLKKYYPASNEAERLCFMSYDLLRSNQNSITLNYTSKEQEGQIEVRLHSYFTLDMPSRYDGWYRVDKNKKCYRFLDEHIGYVTLASIKDEDVYEIKNAFRNTKGIIIDIRNYPSSTEAYNSLSSYFVSSASKPIAYHIRGNKDNPGEFTFSSMLIIPTDGNVFYKGKLIVLINEITFSNAELAAMCYRAGSNTTIIGSTTAGAVGRNPTIVLPGGITTTMTGIGFHFPDGTETQRVGIVPDIWCEPTIEGIWEGRDELLEMAINLINEE